MKARREWDVPQMYIVQWSHQSELASTWCLWVFSCLAFWPRVGPFVPPEEANLPPTQAALIQIWLGVILCWTPFVDQAQCRMRLWKTRKTFGLRVAFPLGKSCKKVVQTTYFNCALAALDLRRRKKVRQNTFFWWAVQKREHSLGEWIAEKGLLLFATLLLDWYSWMGRCRGICILGRSNRKHHHSSSDNHRRRALHSL